MAETYDNVQPFDPRVVAAYDMASTIFRHNDLFDAGVTPTDSDGFALGVRHLTDAQIVQRMDECFGWSPPVMHAVQKARLDTRISNGIIKEE